MNKSKFLKKSLALLLAFMLVFAMIPLGASAAAAVTEVKVNGVTASLTGTTYTAKIPEPGRFAVTATVELVDGNGVIRHEGPNDTNDAVLTNGVWSFTFSDEEKAAGEADFSVYEGRDSDTPTGTFTVKYEAVAASSDTGVSYVELKGQYAVEREGNVFTITAPYGLTSTQLAAAPVAVTLASDKATVDGATQTVADKTWPVTVTDYDTRKDFLVRAEDGTETTYTIIVVYPKPFSSFSIEGERHAARIERVTEGFSAADRETHKAVSNSNLFLNDLSNCPVIEVYLPYGETVSTGPKYEFTPIFETNYDVEIVGVVTGTTDDWRLPGSDVETWESGKTYNLADYCKEGNALSVGALTDKHFFLKVKYSDGNTEWWGLLFDTIQADPVPAIKGLTIENYQAKIEGDNITIDLPKSVRDTATSVALTASKDTEIKVVNSSVPAVTADASNAATLTFSAGDLADGKNKFTLRVTAATAEFDKTAPETRDYYLTINTAAVEAPKLSSMSLQNADGSTTLEAKIDDGKGTILFDDIPYALRNLSEMNTAGWKLFWNISSGATITSNATSIPASGSTVASSATYLPTGNYPADTPVSTRFNGPDGKGTTAADAIVVESPNGKVEYKVTFKNAAANRVSSLDAGNVGLAFNSVTNYDQLTNESQTTATVNNNTKKISAKVYYSDFSNYVKSAGTGNKYDGPALLTTLPEGAEIYFVHPGSDGLYTVDAINSNNKAVSNYIAAPGHLGKDYTKPANSTAAPTPLKLVVVSQALAERVDGTTKNAGPAANTISTLAGLKATVTQENPTSLFSVYDFTLEQLPARTSTKLESVSIYDDATKETISGRVVGNQVNITLPYYFTDTNRPSAGNLYLDYSLTEGGQVVKAALVNPSDADYSDGVDVSPAPTREITQKIYAYSDGSFKASDSTKLVIEANGTMKVDRAKNTDVDPDETFDALNVTAENGTSVQNYALNVTIAPAKETAVLNSVTINGKTATPDAQGNIAITLPFGTEVTSLKPTFNVSENAYVLPYGLSSPTAADVVVPGASFNFLSARQFTVVSENGVTKNHYTITVSVDDEFIDVQEGDWFYDAVMKASGLGWINGKGDGIFDPKGGMKRGDFAQLIANIMNYDEEAYEDVTRFPDVSKDSYYAGAIAWCVDQGYIDGYDDGNFKPNNLITREQVAKIMCNAANLNPASGNTKFADDAKIAGWAKPYINACVSAGIISGKENNLYDPKTNLKRCEAAQLVVDAFSK